MILIKAIKRIKLGKNESRRLRKLKNEIPGIIYGYKKSVIYISLNHDVVFNAQKCDNFYKNLLSIQVNNINYVVRVQSVQMHCFKDRLMHIDFIYQVD